MSDGMAEPQPRLARLDLPGWKSAVNWGSRHPARPAISQLRNLEDHRCPRLGRAADAGQNSRVAEHPGHDRHRRLGDGGGGVLLTPRLRRWGGMLARRAAGGVSRLLRDLLQRAARHGLQLLSVVEARGGAGLLYR